MLNQVSYDPRSYERNLCNWEYRSLKNSGRQWCYEATDVGSWSFVGSNEPVRNECEVIYEIFHIIIELRM